MNNNTYLEIAERIALESKANKLKVGCVLVKNGNIISFSYNGTPPGSDNTCEDEHNHTHPEVIHAESMAITKAARAGVATDGAIAYVTHQPCIDCAKLLYQAGIKEVWFRNTYKNSYGIDFLINQGVTVGYIAFWNKDSSPALKESSIWKS